MYISKWHLYSQVQALARLTLKWWVAFYTCCFPLFSSVCKRTLRKISTWDVFTSGIFHWTCTIAQIWLSFNVFHRNRYIFHTLVGFRHNVPPWHLHFFIKPYKHFLSICFQSMQNSKYEFTVIQRSKSLKLFGHGMCITTHWVANYIPKMLEEGQSSKTLD